MRLFDGTRRDNLLSLESTSVSMMLTLLLSALLLSSLAIAVPVPARMPMPTNELARLAEQDAASLSNFLTEALPAGLRSPATQSFSVAAHHANSPFIDTADEHRSFLTDTSPFIRGRVIPGDRGTARTPGFTYPFDAIHPQPRPRSRPEAFEPEGGPGARAPPNTPERDFQRGGYTTVFGFPGLLPPQQREEVRFVWPPVDPPSRRPRE